MKKSKKLPTFYVAFLYFPEMDSWNPWVTDTDIIDLKNELISMLEEIYFGDLKTLRLYLEGDGNDYSFTKNVLIKEYKNT